jgi:transcriptional regulator with PAS, ATPase and Fis domain
MKSVCAWCQKVLGTRPSEIHPDDIITHGICVECHEKLLGPQKIDWAEFLDSLEIPIVVIDATGKATGANRQARKLLHKELPEIVGFQGGDVFECAYAKLPQGCGNTIHCSGCTIRNTVMDTFESGKSHLEVPAPLIQGTPDKNQELQFLVSTEKVGDVVLLRIDEAGNQ